MTTQPTPIRRNVELQLIRRAWSDPAFEQQLLSDPRQAVETALGVPVPNDIAIEVVQETPTTLYLVLPSRPEKLPAGVLTDADLEAVAGATPTWRWLPAFPTPDAGVAGVAGDDQP